MTSQNTLLHLGRMRLATRWTIGGAFVGLFFGIAAHLAGGAGEAREGVFFMVAALTMPTSLPLMWLVEIATSALTERLFILGAPALYCALIGQVIGQAITWRRSSSRPAAHSPRSLAIENGDSSVDDHNHHRE